MLNKNRLVEHLGVLRRAWDVPALRRVVDDLLSSPTTPNTFLALDTLLSCCVVEGDSDIGLRYAKIKLDLDPSDPFAHSLFGDLLFLTGEFISSLTSYENALRLLGEDTEDSNYFAMTNDVARVYFKQGRNSECRYLCNYHSPILESHADHGIAFLMPYVQRLLLLGDVEAAERNHSLSLELYRKASRATNGRNMMIDIDRSVQEKMWGSVNRSREIV